VAFGGPALARAAVLVRGRAGVRGPGPVGAAAATLGTGREIRPGSALMVTPGRRWCRRIRWSGGSGRTNRHPVAGLRGHVHRGGRRLTDHRDGGASYRARLEQLIRSGRPSPGSRAARSSQGRDRRGHAAGSQVQGVWVRPRSVARAWPRRAWPRSSSRRPVDRPLVSLYVNDFNARRGGVPPVGFTETGQLMSVMF